MLLQGLNAVISKVKEVNTDLREFRTLLVFLTPPSVFKEWKVAPSVWERVKTSAGEDAKTVVCDQEVWCLDKRDRCADVYIFHVCNHNYLFIIIEYRMSAQKFTKIVGNIIFNGFM